MKVSWLCCSHIFGLCVAETQFFWLDFFFWQSRQKCPFVSPGFPGLQTLTKVTQISAVPVCQTDRRVGGSSGGAGTYKLFLCFFRTGSQSWILYLLLTSLATGLLQISTCIAHSFFFSPVFCNGYTFQDTFFTPILLFFFCQPFSDISLLSPLMPQSRAPPTYLYQSLV